MSARMTAMRSDYQLAEDEASALGPPAPTPTPAALFGADTAVDALFRPRASERLLQELLRRFGTPDPLPWRHGGLNE
jgi:hypothetical protein